MQEQLINNDHSHHDHQELPKSVRRRPPLLQRNASENWTATKSLELLEAQLQQSKESECKMLESLAVQTKQLEQTKISLEEAKLEINSLQEIVSSFDKNGDIGSLKTELRLALQAEEKSKRAMDDLAVVLKEVSTESKQAKERVSKLETELSETKSEGESLKEMLRSAKEESRRMKVEIEESSSAWRQKEDGFIDFMKITEEEVGELKQENDRLTNAVRSAREEASRLRDIVKQAVNDSNVFKDALEIARSENARLQDELADKERELESVKQEYESLKVSEAAAVDSVRELSSLLTATSSVGSTSSSIDAGPFGRAQQNMRRDSNTRSESGKFETSIFDMAWSPPPLPEEKKDHWSARNSSSKGGEEDEDDDLNLEEYYSSHGGNRGGRFEESPEMECASPSRQKKKRPSFRKIGEMFRRSFKS